VIFSIVLNQRNIRRNFISMVEDKKLESFSLTRVATKNIIIDSFQGLRNLLGLRLRGYESMITKHTNQIMYEVKLEYDIKWYRLSINPLTNGSVMITAYGEGNKK